MKPKSTPAMPNTLTMIFHAAIGSRKEAIREPLRPFLLDKDIFIRCA